jgi:Spherulation-specific family 4/PEP-CTERM motif
MLPRIKTFASLAILLGLSLAITPARAAPIDIFVPAYFYPSFAGSPWDQLTEAVRSGVQITAIMNPASGPGIGQNSDYVRAIGNFRAAGGKVLGYVPSGYLGQAVSAGSSCQPGGGAPTYAVADVVGCAGLYQANYNIDGIFVDEFGPPVGGASDAAVLGFYQSVYNGVKTINPDWQIVGNPGTVINAALLRKGNIGGADRLVTFENAFSAYPGAALDAASLAEPADRFINIIYDFQNPLNLDALVANLSSRNIGGVFITSDVLSNPYDSLPSYFAAEVAAIARFNAAQSVPEPASYSLLGLGLLAALWRRRTFMASASPAAEK